MKSALSMVIEANQEIGDDTMATTISTTPTKMWSDVETWIARDKFVVNNIELRYNNLCREINEMNRLQKLIHKDKIEEFNFYKKLYELLEKRYPKKSDINDATNS